MTQWRAAAISKVVAPQHSSLSGSSWRSGSSGGDGGGSVGNAAAAAVLAVVLEERRQAQGLMNGCRHLIIMKKWSNSTH